MGGQVAAVAIAPDGTRALAAKFPEHKVALLAIDGQTVTYDGQDIPVGSSGEASMSGSSGDQRKAAGLCAEALAK